MPRYSDRNTRLYVGRLSSHSRARDLEDLFSRYGRIRDVDMKHDYAFVEFRDPRDADDARYALDGRQFDGSRLIVEFAKGVPRGPGGSREYYGRGPPPGTGRCFNCGIDGHWARDCRAGDWKNKCYRCGERGHIERNCPNSPKNPRHGRSYSRSVSRSPSRRGRGRSRSYSRSRSPPVRRDRRSEERQSVTPEHSRSPRREESPPVNARSRDVSPVPSRKKGSSMSPPPKVRKQTRDETNGSDYSQSPTRDQSSRSPKNRDSVSPRSPGSRDSRSPRSPRNGDSMSSPADDRNKIDPNRQNGSDYSQSPGRGRDNRSPMSRDGRSPYDDRRPCSPEAAHGRSPSQEAANGRSPRPEAVNGLSPSPKEDGSDNRPSPQGCESPHE